MCSPKEVVLLFIFEFTESIMRLVENSHRSREEWPVEQVERCSCDKEFGSYCLHPTESGLFS